MICNLINIGIAATASVCGLNLNMERKYGVTEDANQEDPHR